MKMKWGRREQLERFGNCIKCSVVGDLRKKVRPLRRGSSVHFFFLKIFATANTIAVPTPGLVSFGLLISVCNSLIENHISSDFDIPLLPPFFS